MDINQPQIKRTSVQLNVLSGKKISDNDNHRVHREPQRKKLCVAPCSLW